MKFFHPSASVGYFNTSSVSARLSLCHLILDKPFCDTNNLCNLDINGKCRNTVCRIFFPSVKTSLVPRLTTSWTMFQIGELLPIQHTIILTRMNSLISQVQVMLFSFRFVERTRDSNTTHRKHMF